MQASTDEELVYQVQQGSILAFEQLIKRYQARLLRFTRRITLNEALAEEVVQDAFFSVYTHINNVDPSKKFSSFLYAIARNGAISVLRRERGKHISLHEMEHMAGDAVPPLEDLVTHEERGRVHKAIRGLRSIHRRVIELYYFDELSYEAIARKLKLPINTVRTHLRRAKLVLEELLHETD